MTSKKVLTAILAGTLAASGMTAKAQQSSIELMQTTEKSTSRVRPNLFYSLPFGVKGYTFIEFYEDGQSYFAKTGLTKKIAKDIDARVEVLDFSFTTDKIGLGLEYKIPTEEGTFAKVKAMPVYFGFDGKYVQSKAVLGFYFEQKVYVPILKDAKVVAFGEINMAAKSGPTWSYGELHIQKSLEDFVLGIGADLTCDGKITPHPELSIKLGYVFGHKKAEKVKADKHKIIGMVDSPSENATYKVQSIMYPQDDVVIQIQDKKYHLVCVAPSCALLGDQETKTLYYVPT